MDHVLLCLSSGRRHDVCCAWHASPRDARGQGQREVGDRGRYRYADYFSGDAEYDDEIATPTLTLGAGVRLWRTDAFDLNAYFNLALSPFCSEVAVAVAQVLVGPSWTYE